MGKGLNDDDVYEETGIKKRNRDSQHMDMNQDPLDSTTTYNTVWISPTRMDQQHMTR